MKRWIDCAVRRGARVAVRKSALILLGNHAFCSKRVGSSDLRATPPPPGTYVVLRVGRYSNKAESNSIHWREGVFRAAAAARSGGVVAAGGEVGENKPPPIPPKLRANLYF